MKTVITVIVLITTSSSHNKWQKIAKESAIKTDIQVFGEPIEDYVDRWSLKMDSLILTQK